jgi:hypothetical protein
LVMNFLSDKRPLDEVIFLHYVWRFIEECNEKIIKVWNGVE